MNRTRLHSTQLQAPAYCYVTGAADEPAADIRDLRSTTDLQQTRPTRLSTPRIQDPGASSTITPKTTGGNAVTRTRIPPAAHQDDDGGAHAAVCMASPAHRHQALEETRDSSSEGQRGSPREVSENGPENWAYASSGRVASGA